MTIPSSGTVSGPCSTDSAEFQVVGQASDGVEAVRAGEVLGAGRDHHGREDAE